MEKTEMNVNIVENLLRLQQSIPAVQYVIHGEDDIQKSASFLNIHLILTRPPLNVDQLETIFNHGRKEVVMLDWTLYFLRKYSL